MKKPDQRPIQWDNVAVWGLGILFAVLFWAGIICLIWG